MDINFVRNSHASIIFFLLLTGLFISGALDSSAQVNNRLRLSPEAVEMQKQYGLDPNSTLLSRIRKTPDDIIRLFHDAGMSPTSHQLTADEEKIVSLAIDALPPLYKKVLNNHLVSISFLDNMPNTALTSTVTDSTDFKLFHISFRAGILHQTISEWVTEKERSCYADLDSSLTVSIEAGLLSALTYVLLHEGTHVVDGSLGLLSLDSTRGHYQPTSFKEKFTKGIWNAHTSIGWRFNDTLVLRNRYRPGGRTFLQQELPLVYDGLSKTPFVSLYATSSWNEELAELLTITYLTRVLKQPFRISVRRNGKEVAGYKLMKSKLVSNRADLLKMMYGADGWSW